MQAVRKLRVDVVSDTVCPWCMVGKKRLEAAMQRFADKKGGVEFEVWWHPYQLKPDAPQEGVNKLAMYKQLFGPARAEAMISMMTQTFSELGLQYNIDGLTGNTANSHRLIAWAGATGGAATQNALVQELFSNYFCEAKFINDHEVLVAAAAKVGLDAHAARKLIEGSAGQQELQQELQRARAQGISGVPHFTIGEYRLSGAQPPEEFEKVFEAAWAASAAGA